MSTGPLAPLTNADLDAIKAHAAFDRVRANNDPALADLLLLARIECDQAIDALPPNAPTNGNVIDPSHAGNCALRASMFISRAERAMTAERAAVRALVEALAKCIGHVVRGSGGHTIYSYDCNEPATRWDPESTIDNERQCDRHFAMIHPTFCEHREPLPYAAPLRALLAVMATWPAASPCAECSVVATASDVYGIHPVTREYVCRGCAETIDPRSDAGTIAVATPEQLAVRWPSWVKVGLKVRGRGNTSTVGVPITLVEDHQLRIGTDVYHLAWTGRFEKLWEVVPDSHAPRARAAARAEADRLKTLSEAARDDYMAAECHARALETRETEARWKARALLADGAKVEELAFYDCIILGASRNAAGERVIFVATCDGEGDTAVRHIHAVVDESTYLAYRRGEATLKTILEAAPFYLVARPEFGAEATVVEMNWTELAERDRPTEESFCPAHARLPAVETPR